MLALDSELEQYTRAVFRFLMSLTHNAQLAEELTQETMYQAVKSQSRYDPQQKMTVWLFQIAKHCWYDALKKQTRGYTAFAKSQPPAPPTLEEQADDHDTATRMLAHIHALAEPYKEILLLRIYGEQSFAEIGALFGRSENWARVTFYRAKQQIKERMNDGEPNNT